jgi:hypothetical protein
MPDTFAITTLVASGFFFIGSGMLFFINLAQAVK